MKPLSDQGFDIQTRGDGYWAVWYDNESLLDLREEGPFQDLRELGDFAKVVERG